MAIQKITYNDKVAIHTDSAIPAINKCRANDLNQIKTVVNNNADEIPSNDNLVNVGTSVDTDYKTNILTTKNLLDTNSLTIGTFTYDDNGNRFSTNNYVGIEFISVKPNTTYTFSATMPSQYTSVRYVQFDSSKTFISRSGDNAFSGSVSFTIGNNCYYIAILCYKTTNNASTSDLVNPMLNEGSTATTYEAFIPNTINVNNEKYTDTINVGTSINDKNRVNVLKSNNLYNGSQDFSGTWGNSGSWTTDDNTYNGLVVKKRAAAWNGIYKEIDVVQGKTYTFSAYVKSDSNKSTRMATGGGTSGISEGLTIDITPTWQRYSLTFTATASGTIRARIENTADGGTNNTYICGYQLEESPTMTSYEPYITPSINIDGEEIYNANLMNYSTEEQVIGKWIDGKPIYRKVIDCGNLPNATSKNVEIGYSINQINIVRLYGTARENTGYTIPIPHVSSGLSSSQVQCEVSTNGIFLRTGVNYSSLHCYMVLEYTKTS